jgi:hypothetical protein
LVVLLGVVAGAAPVGAAQNSLEKKEDKARAAEYFNRAEVLFEAGQFSKAAQAFILAYEQAPHPSVMANVAVSFDKAGSNVEAVNWYRRYLAQTSGAKDDVKIRGRLKQLEQAVGELRVTCAQLECQVRVDRVEVGEAPLNIVVIPGMHVVDAVIHGVASPAKNIDATAGQVVPVEVGGAPVVIDEESFGSESTEEPSKERKARGFSLRPMTWVALGGTVVFGGLAVGFGAATLSTKADFKNSGYSDPDLAKKGDSYKIATNVFIAAAGVAALTTVVLIVLDARAKRNKSAENTAEVIAGMAPIEGGLSALVTVSF